LPASLLPASRPPALSRPLPRRVAGFPIDHWGFDQRGKALFLCCRPSHSSTTFLNARTNGLQCTNRVPRLKGANRYRQPTSIDKRGSITVVIQSEPLDLPNGAAGGGQIVVLIRSLAGIDEPVGVPGTGHQEFRSKTRVLGLDQRRDFLVNWMAIDSSEPVFRVPVIRLATMHDRVPIRARRAADVLADCVRFVEEVVKKPQTRSTTGGHLPIGDWAAIPDRFDVHGLENVRGAMVWLLGPQSRRWGGRDELMAQRAVLLSVDHVLFLVRRFRFVYRKDRRVSERMDYRNVSWLSVVSIHSDTVNLEPGTWNLELDTLCNPLDDLPFEECKTLVSAEVRVGQLVLIEP
jgi:hypothetical protein